MIKINGLPLNTPDPMTVTTVAKLIAVKILFKTLDSLTPADSTMASAIIMKNAQKSRYGAKNGISIGIHSLKSSDIRLPNNSSKYPLNPRATLDVPVCM